jgi:hypothetical protein
MMDSSQRMGDAATTRQTTAENHYNYSVFFIKSELKSQPRKEPTGKS